MHRFFIYDVSSVCSRCFLLLLLFMRHTLRAIYTTHTRDHINKTAEWQKQTESACLSSGNCEMNESRCKKTHTHAREHSHCIGLLPACLPAAACVFSLVIFIYACDDFCLLSFFLIFIQR